MALQVEAAANAVVTAVETLTTMNTMAIIVTCGYSVLYSFISFNTPVLFFATNSSFRLDFRLKECIQLRLKFLEF